MDFKEIRQWIIGVIFGVAAVITVVLPAQCFLLAKGTVTDTLPVTPDDFVPTVRLALFTDTHNKNDRVAKAIDTAYEFFDNDSTYAGIDGFFCLGDFSSVGGEGDYVNYINTVREHAREETPFITIHGNHEFKDDGYKEYFVRNFGYDPDTVTEINGFSCIAFSGERSLTEWTFTPKSLKWLDESITEAEKKNDSRAIFVFQHPHPWGTVYGSTTWGDPQINIVLNKHPGIVDFSGHSHFPANDPRGILQTTYTAVNCGSFERFELADHCIPGQHPDGCEPAAQLNFVEADNDGSVRLRLYDLISDTWICDRYIENVNDPSTYAYTYKNMYAHDEKPVFKEDAKASAAKNENGEWVISFDEAQAAEGFIVHNYRVIIKDEKGRAVFNDGFINDYFVFDDDDTADFRIGADTLESGRTYTVTVIAESAYHKLSEPAKFTFTAA
ncbi:MAG: metallophosphoesterase [Clostridiales bacterium]|nr:metallophosphoesterase [Clostridiales bacterium]